MAALLLMVLLLEAGGLSALRVPAPMQQEGSRALVWWGLCWLAGPGLRELTAPTKRARVWEPGAPVA
jgi:hypothetical protein